MITNDICTILRMNNVGDKEIIAAYDCMWQGTDGCGVKKYGENNEDKADIYIPDVNADVKKGDFIFKGLADKINDTYDMLTVMSVSRHDYGSECMRHVRIGAR